jgi:hypothetical protein
MKMLRRAPHMKTILKHLGLNHKRFRLEWCSASEGQRWAQLNREFVEELKELGPSPMRDRLKRMNSSEKESFDDILAGIKFETVEKESE